MLVLTRRTSESIVIGDDVIVTVLGFSGNQVRFGISAPPQLSVHREEIYKKLRNQKFNKELKNERI